MMVEDEVHIIIPPIQIQSPMLQLTYQTPSFIKNTSDSMPNHYDRFKTRPPRGTQLKCRQSPFFQDLPKIPEVLKSFYDDIFTSEGDIFESCSFDWVHLKKTTIVEVFHMVEKLETFNILEIPKQTVSEVAGTVGCTR